MQCGTWQEVRCSSPVVLFSYFFSLKGSEGSGGLGMWYQIMSLGLRGHPKVTHDSGYPENIRHPCEPAVFLVTAALVLRGSGSGCSSGCTTSRLMVWSECRHLLHTPHLSPWASVCSALKLMREGMGKGKTIIYLLFHLIRKAYPAPPTSLLVTGVKPWTRLTLALQFSGGDR